MDSLILWSPPYPLVRMGSLTGDGGYMVCSLPDSYDIIITGGVSSEVNFELDMCKMYSNLKCIAFDGTVNSLPTHSDRITFIKQNLGTGTDGTTNLREYLDKYQNVFLKMDIEGHEFRILPEIYDMMKHVKQLVVEIHTPADIQLYPNYYKGLSDITHGYMFDMFRRIGETHTLVHVHPNNGCAVHACDGILLPNVFECTFVRNEFVTSKIKNTLPLPMHFDKPNVLDKPIIVFNKYPFRNER